MEKHYVYSARTTERGLALLNKTKGDMSWDTFINTAVASHYSLDLAVLALPPSPFVAERAAKKAAKEKAKADKARAAAKAKAEKEAAKKAKADKAKADKTDKTKVESTLTPPEVKKSVKRALKVINAAAEAEAADNNPAHVKARKAAPKAGKKTAK